MFIYVFLAHTGKWLQLFVFIITLKNYPQYNNHTTTGSSKSLLAVLEQKSNIFDSKRHP